MSYPRFTKIIIDYFMSIDQSISRRNKMFWHTDRDDTMFTAMRCISRHEDTQVYGTILPKDLTNQAMLESKAYKTYYAFAFREKTPKPKYVRKKSDSDTSPKQKPVQATKGDGTDFESGVPDEQHLKTTGADEGTGDSGEEDEDDENDSKDESDGNDDDDANDDNQEGDDMNDDDKETDSDRIESDRIKIPVLNQSSTEYYKKKKKRLMMKKRWMKKKIMRSLRRFEQVEEDAHVKLTSVLETQKTDEPVQSSSISSEFTSKLLNLENPSLADNEIASLMDTTARHATTVPEITSSFTTTIPPPPLFNDRVTNLEKDLSEIKQVDQYAQALSSIPAIVDQAAVLARSSSQPKSTYEATASLSKFELIKILLDKMEESKSHLRADYKKKLYDALMTEKKIETPPLDHIEGRKEGNQAKKLNHPEIQGQRKKKSSSTSKDASQSQHKHSGKSAYVEEPKPHTSSDELMDTLFDFSSFVLNRLNIKYPTQEILVGPAFELLKGTCKSLTKLEYHLEECSKVKTERLDWHNPEGKPYPFDLSKPLPLIRDHQVCQVIPRDFFINNDLEYLKGGDLSRRYSTSVTKTKAATYEIKWIEDLVHNL
ncbi:hypothetical protein Tco_0995286 [Tanacetum coccineum]